MEECEARMPDAGCRGQGLFPCILHPASSSLSQRRHINIIEVSLVIAHVLYLTL